MKPILTLLSLIAGIVIGWWLHLLQTEKDTIAGRMRSKGMNAPSVIGAPAKVPGGTIESQVHAFNAGQPFLPGQAKEWLLRSLAHSKTARGDDSEVLMFDLTQSFMTMDESSAKEAAETLMEFTKLYMAHDPLVRSAVDSEGPIWKVLSMAVNRWAQLNPKAALDITGRLSGPGGEIAQTVFARLAVQDPAYAVSRLDGLFGSQLTDALEGTLRGLSISDPDAAVALVEKYPDAGFDEERRHIVERLMVRDPLPCLLPRALRKTGCAVMLCARDWICG